MAEGLALPRRSSLIPSAILDGWGVVRGGAYLKIVRSMYLIMKVCQIKNDFFYIVYAACERGSNYAVCLQLSSLGTASVEGVAPSVTKACHSNMPAPQTSSESAILKLGHVY